jgi:hypothetical protein
MGCKKTQKLHRVSGKRRMRAKNGEWIMAEGVGFEPTREQNPLPVFKTGALNHSATLPSLKYQTLTNV